MERLDVMSINPLITGKNCENIKILIVAYNQPTTFIPNNIMHILGRF